MPMFPSWHAYSKMASSLPMSGIITVQGRAQVVGSVIVTS